MGYNYSPQVCALIFLIIFQWLAALGRLYVRAFLVKRTGWDDAAMVMTLLLSTAFIGLMVTVALWTGQQNISHVPGHLLFPAIRMTLALLVTYIVASVFLKIALALLLLRVLVRRWQVIVIYVTISISVVYGTFYFFYVLFECGAPSKFPTRIILGQCLKPEVVDGVSYAHAVFNASADIIFLCMPIALLWKENMSRRSKISICTILGIGSVGGICTIIRIAYIHTLTKATPTFFMTSTAIAVTSATELSVGVSCICFSTYKPLIRKFFPRDGTQQPTFGTTEPIASGTRPDSFHTADLSVPRPASPSEYGEFEMEKGQSQFVDVRHVR